MQRGENCAREVGGGFCQLPRGKTISNTLQKTQCSVFSVVRAAGYRRPGKLQQSVVNDLGAAGGVRGHPVARGRENCVVWHGIA